MLDRFPQLGDSRKTYENMAREVNAVNFLGPEPYSSVCRRFSHYVMEKLELETLKGFFWISDHFLRVRLQVLVVKYA